MTLSISVKVIEPPRSTVRPQHFNGWGISPAHRMTWACGCSGHEQIFYRSNADAPRRRLSRRELFHRAEFLNEDVFECMKCFATLTRADFKSALPQLHPFEEATYP